MVFFFFFQFSAKGLRESMGIKCRLIDKKNSEPAIEDGVKIAMFNP
jgi:hypothetical protein